MNCLPLGVGTVNSHITDGHPKVRPYDGMLFSDKERAADA